MKSKWTFFGLLLLFSLTVLGADFEILIDAQKDAYYNTLTGPSDGWLWIPSIAFNDNGPQPDDVIGIFPRIGTQPGMRRIFMST